MLPPPTPSPHPLLASVVLGRARALVYGSRREDYGHPLDDFTRTAKMFSAILDTEVTPEQASLCMVAVKISRLCHGWSLDSAVDVAGYAEVLALIVEERKRRKNPATLVGMTRAMAEGMQNAHPPTPTPLSTSET